MSKTNSQKRETLSPEKAPLVAFQIKLKPDMRKRIFAAAESHNLSAADIANMALNAGLDRVITKLGEIRDPLPEKQAA